MANWKNLPAEILDTIFEKIHAREKIQSSLTCRNWRSAAQRALFDCLPSLNDLQMYDLLDALSYNTSELSPGNFVRRLKCEGLSENFDFVLLDRLFPFVEAIDISLKNSRIIHQLVHEGVFPDLKQLPLFEWDSTLLELALSRKDHIKVIEMHNFYFEIFENLQLFPKLESLGLRVYENQNNRTFTTVSLEHLLSRDLPQVKSISVRLPSDSKFDFSTLPASGIQPFQNIKDVYIYAYETFFNEEESYFYLMKKFPHPEVLKLYSGMNLQVLRNHYLVPPVACLHQFLVYLFNIRKESTAMNIITDQHTPHVVAGFFNYALNQKSKHFKKVELHFILNWGEVEDSRQQDDYLQDNFAHIEVRNNLKGSTKVCEVTAKYATIISLPGTKLFQQLGNINIQSLTLGSREERELKDGVPIVLNTDFDDLPKLKTLRICRWNGITCSIKNEIEEPISSILETLVFEGCRLREGIFPQISIRYPNLKKIEFTYCYFSKDQGGLYDYFQAEARTIPIVMQSTSLDELFFRMRIDEHLYVLDYHRIYIRLKTAKGKPRYCKIFWERREAYCVLPEDGDTEYSKCLKDKDCVIYDIYCEAITKLTIHALPSNCNNKGTPITIY